MEESGGEGGAEVISCRSMILFSVVQRVVKGYK